MAEYTRVVGLAGESIQLRAVFVDSAGNLIDPDVTPVLYIYEPSTESDVVSTEIDEETYESAVAGPLTATRLSTGFYSYEYVVPTDYEAGVWHDVWVGTVNGLVNQKMLSFLIEETIDISDQSIGNNTMLVVELDASITNADGTSSLSPTSLYFTTVYKPLYGSPDLVRTELGPWIDYIPDDTLALMLHWASREADFIQGWKSNSAKNIQFARTKFVVFDAAYRAVMSPGAGNVAGYSSGGKKQLGDLTIEQGDIVTTVPTEILTWLQEQRREWWRVVNAGGLIVPGQGLGTVSAVKGLYDPDRRLGGRLWEDPKETNFIVPTVNRKTATGSRRRGRWEFKENYRYK